MDPQEESLSAANKRPRVNDNYLQRMLETNAAIKYSNQMIVAHQSMANRPVNTIKAYAAKQKEWTTVNLIMYNDSFTNMFQLELV